MAITRHKLILSSTQRFLLRSVGIIVCGLFINQLVQTAGSMILARMLDDPAAFGEVNLMLQIFGMALLFLNVGFNSALVYTFSRDAEEAKRNKFRLALVGSTLFGVLISLLLSALAPAIASYYGLPALESAIRVGSIMLIFNSVANIGLAAFSGSRNFATQATFMVLMNTFATIGLLAGVLWASRHAGAEMLWSISFWTGIGSVMTALIISLRVAQVHRPRWTGTVPLREMGRMLRYGVPMWAGNIAKAFQQPFLVMMIGSSSVVAVGYVTNAFRITGFIGIITWAFMIVTFPFVAESSRDLTESRRRGTLCIRYNNLILYPLTLLICLYPNQINEFLFGSSYTTDQSAAYIRLSALGVFFSSISRLGGNILAGIGRTKANFWVMLVAGIVVVAFVPLAADRSPVVSVWIYTGGWAASALAMFWFFRHEGFSPDWRDAYIEPLLPTLAMGAFLGAGHWAGGYFFVFAILGLAALTAATWWIEAAKTRPGAAAALPEDSPGQAG